MKIEAYSEQKKAASIYEEQRRQAEAMKGSVSGAALTQAVSFTKIDNSMDLFGTSNYADGDVADKTVKTMEEFTDEAQALLDNMKAITNKMDTGELVTMDDEGVDVNELDTKKIVTVGEQIRIKLAAAGNEHVYTDDIDEADIKRIYGEGSTAVIKKVLDKYNLPMTDDNVNEIQKAVETAHELKSPDIGTKSYLMNNNMVPTVENLYKAEYASGRGQSDGVLTDKQWDELRPQIEGMLDKAGIESSQENLDEMRSLVETGTRINDESLEIYRQTKEAQELIDSVGNFQDNEDNINLFDEVIADKAAAAMVDGDRAMQVNISDEPVAWKKAAKAVDTLENVTTAALLEFLQGNSYENNLDGLSQAADEAHDTQDDSYLNPLDYYNLPSDIELNDDGIHKLRCLEELRLKMTFESAYILEKNGIDVNTQELSKLVEELKKLEVPEYKAVEDNENRSGLEDDNAGLTQAVKDTDATDYRRFMYELGSLKGAPGAAIGDAVLKREVAGGEIVFADIRESAVRLERQYKEAGQAYETMSTQIRPDLGDKISNAVAAGTENVLKELDEDNTEENRRAVRILAYNNMEVTQERLDKVKKIDAAVNNLFDRMTPDIALELLREGSDVMNMDITELAKEVEAKRQQKEEVSTQKFSEYLYEQDKKGTISQEDRQQYMALYTIINKLTKDNGKAAGQLVNQNMDATIGNLVTSYMISNAAGIEAGASEDETEYRQGARNNAKLSYYKELLSELSKLPKQAAELVTENNLPQTINNLSAAGALYSDNAYFYKELKKSSVDADLERFMQSMDSKKELLESYNELSEKLKEAMNTAGEEAKLPDISLLKQLSKGMTFMKSLAGNNTFYIPYDSENKTCAIKLSVVEDSESSGSFTVDMEDENGEHISVRARVQDDEINAYVLSQSDCSEILEQVREGLAGLGFSKVKLSTAKTNQFGETKNGTPSAVETRKLFAAAKVFVEKFR